MTDQVVELSEGRQLLIADYGDQVEVAYRADPADTWHPPITVTAERVS